MKIQLIRNATVKISFGGKVWLVDPFLGDVHSLPSFAGKSTNPIVPLPISIEEILKDVDYVLITHLHPDHFDSKAQEKIPKHIPILLQPSDLEAFQNLGFDQLEIIDTKKELKGVKISRVPAQHGEGTILNVMGTVSGYVLEAKGKDPLYITGDTIWFDGIRKTIDEFAPKVIICNAGGNVFSPEHNIFKEQISLERTYKVIMDEVQVFELLEYKKDTKIITVHIGALDHETVTRKSMKAYLEHKKVDINRFYIPEDGAIITI